MTAKRAEQLATSALFLVLAAGCGLFFYHAFLAIGFPFTLDYGEGPLLNQARLLARGQNIYHAELSDYPFTVGNYPPLFVGVLAVASKLFGLSFALGRALVLTAALVSGALVAGIVHTLARDRLAALGGGLFFLISPLVVFWSPLVRVDFLALALSLSGVFVAARRPEARSTPFIAAALLTGAALARQSYLLAAPLTVAGWLWTRQRRGTVAFVAAFVVGVMICFLALNFWTAGGFFFNVVTANANRFSTGRLFSSFVALGLSAPLIVVLPLLDARRLKSAPLPALYLLGSLLSALTVGKVGSSLNYFLELVAALAVYAGVTLARWRSSKGAAHARALLLALLTLQAGWMLWWNRLPITVTTERVRLRAELAALRRTVAQERGPVLADEHMGLLVLTGHDLLLQPYELTLLAQEDKWDPTPVVTDLQAGRFALVLVSDRPPYTAKQARDRWTAGMWAALQTAYEPAGVLGGTTMYRPKKPVYTITGS